VGAESALIEGQVSATRNLAETAFWERFGFDRIVDKKAPGSGGPVAILPHQGFGGL